jgi:hypothetical protein
MKIRHRLLAALRPSRKTPRHAAPRGRAAHRANRATGHAVLADELLERLANEADIEANTVRLSPRPR